MRYLILVAGLFLLFITDTACRKKTTVTPVDSFFVHYWRIDSAKTTLMETRTQSFILSNVSTSDPAFKKVVTYKTTNVAPVSYMVISQNLDNTYTISPYFNYSKGKITTSTSTFTKYEGKSLNANGTCQFQEFLTVQTF